MYKSILLILVATILLSSCTSGERNSTQDNPMLSGFVVYPSAGTGEESVRNDSSGTQGDAIPVGIPDSTCSGAHIIDSDVRGTSMVPLYQDGDTIRYSSGYYHCFDVKRNDIVIYHHPRELIIKRVVAVPGDTWKYLSGKIFIGGKVLKNSEEKEYNIDSKMLDLYAHSYPTIPSDTYLILGNQVGGTLDSSRFGLVAKQDIVGKVIAGK